MTRDSSFTAFLRAPPLALVFAASLVALIPNLQASPNAYDEGLAIYSAMRVQMGDVPYVDFWALYGPGQIYTLAAVFDLFGATLETERLWDTLVRAVMATLLYLVARRLYAGWLGVLSWGCAIGWLTLFERFSYPVYPALALGFAALLLVETRWRAAPSMRRMLAAGVATGAATAFRHDFGFYLMIGCVCGFVAAVLRRGPSSDLPRLAARPLGVYAAGIATVVLPVTLYLAARGGVEPLVHHLFVAPATVFPEFRSLPVPPPIPNVQPLLGGEQTAVGYLLELMAQLPFTLFPLLLVAALIKAGTQIRTLPHDAERAKALPLVVAVAVLGIALLNQARVRTDAIHLMPAALMAFLTLPYLAGLGANGGAVGTRRHASVAAWMACFLLAAGLLLEPAMRQRDRIRDFDAASLPSGPANPDRDEAVAYVRANTASAEAIYVGLPRHDRIFVNDVLFYFLAERPSATRYHELHPGIVTTSEVQHEIIRELEAAGLRLLVIHEGLADTREPNAAGESSGVTLLDDFIATHFEEVARFGPYSVRARRDSRQGAT